MRQAVDTVVGTREGLPSMPSGITTTGSSRRGGIVTAPHIPTEEVRRFIGADTLVMAIRGLDLLSRLLPLASMTERASFVLP